MARSIKNQEFWLQKETAPGIATETAMKRPGSLKLRPGYTTNQETWRGQGSRVINGVIKNSEFAGFSVDGMQDFNALQWALDSLLGFVTPTTPVGATNARQRVWNLATIGALTPATYTGIWGDATQAVKLLHAIFNSLSLSFNRGALSFSSAVIARKPATGATKPAQGATHKYISPAPIAGRNYGVWMDSSWAALGTTRALAVYEGGIDIGETWAPDWPVNDLLPSFESVVENEEIDYTSKLTLGFDAAAVTHIGEWDTDVMKFLRFKATGGLIEAGQNYSLMIDQAVRIINPGEFGTAPSSPTVVVPFSYAVTEDPVSSNALQITLVNNVP